MEDQNFIIPHHSPCIQVFENWICKYFFFLKTIIVGFCLNTGASHYLKQWNPNHPCGPCVLVNSCQHYSSDRYSCIAQLMYKYQLAHCKKWLFSKIRCWLSTDICFYCETKHAILVLKMYLHNLQLSSLICLKFLSPFAHVAWGYFNMMF